MAEIIPVSTGQTDFVDFTVAPGTTRALFIKGTITGAVMPDNVTFGLAHKDPAGNYTIFDRLTAQTINQKGCISAPGTYGVRRSDANPSFAGLDIEG